jgi:hypothetical protein
MVPGTQKKAAAEMVEIIIPVSLPSDMVIPIEPIAPELHHLIFCQLITDLEPAVAES